MVKAIAEATGVVMPVLRGYVARWSLRYLVPVLAMMVLVFLATDVRLRLLGACLALAYLAWHLAQAWRSPAAAPLPAPVGTDRDAGA